jgi:excisionase family DNA binding protein
MLRQSRGSIYRKIAAGELEAVRLGRSRSSPLRIRTAALDAHLQPVEPAPPLEAA